MSYLQKLKEVPRRYSFWILIVVIIFGVSFFSNGKENSFLKKSSVLFVGDVMLARNVETLMDQHGLYYPFDRIRDFLNDHEVVVANFEGSVPILHKKTPIFTFRFSVREEMLEPLRNSGVEIATLANNHTYDHGVSGYENTKKTLEEVGIITGGSPQAVSFEDIIFNDIDNHRLAIIPVNATFGMPTLDSVLPVLLDAEKQSDIQIVSIHWGTEYVLNAGSVERTFAEHLIDNGVDGIIGHHPHVVQGIEIYRGVPIFYSLGNFIFDQYWNEDVQTGLTVSLSFTKTKIEYTLVPVTSIDLRSSPRVMDRVERTKFLYTLSEISDEELLPAIRKGEITQILSF